MSYPHRYRDALRRYAAAEGQGKPLSLAQRLKELTPKLLAAAQEEYDAWDQSDDEYGDPECGFGGICDRISDAMSAVLAQEGIDTVPLGQDGDDHAWFAAYDDHEAHEIDIPPDVYEKGGGYNWTKLPDVTFEPDHLIISPVNRADILGEDS